MIELQPNQCIVKKEIEAGSDSCDGCIYEKYRGALHCNMISILPCGRGWLYEVPDKKRYIYEIKEYTC